MLHVDVQCASEHPDVPDEDEVRHWARAAASAGALAHDAQLGVRIVDLAEGVALNSAYRGKAGPTNVLSFGFEAAEHTQPPLLGDVVLCAPVVAREAMEQGKSVREHFAHLVVHGVLHLLGHDHEAAADAACMEGLERVAMGLLGHPDPYADHGGASP